MTEAEYGYKPWPKDKLYYDGLVDQLEEAADEIERLRGENYTDLLDQMDEAWGNAREIGRAEINAFMESRIVHKPTTSLRATIAKLQDKLSQSQYNYKQSVAAYKVLVELMEKQSATTTKLRDEIGRLLGIIQEKDRSIVVIEEYRLKGLDAIAATEAPPMTPEERQIRNVFFQARRMNIYENEPVLVTDLAGAIRAVVEAEREACAELVTEVVTKNYLDFLDDGEKAAHLIREAILTRGEEG